MTVLIHDVDQQLSTPLPYCFAASVPYYDIEYADDTLLIARTAQRLQEILTAVETQSAKYGMSLNTSKTSALAMNALQDPRVTFLDGSHLKFLEQHQMTEVEYVCLFSPTVRWLMEAASERQDTEEDFVRHLVNQGRAGVICYVLLC